MPRQKSNPASVSWANAAAVHSGFTLRHWLDQFIAELAAEHRRDLGNGLSRWPEPIQTSRQ